MLIRDLFFQLILFLGGLSVGIFAPNLPQPWQRRLGLVCTVLLVAISSAWGGYEVGRRQQLLNAAPLPPRSDGLIAPPTAPLPTDTPTQSPTVSTEPTCSPNLLNGMPWRLEATTGPAEASAAIADPGILEGKDTLFITYNLHGLMAQEGSRKDDSAIIFDVFEQPNWYVASLATHGKNGLDGKQSVLIPLSDFISLSDSPSRTPGGKELLGQPVTMVHTRFWHDGHFVVDITNISLCSSQQ